MQVTHPPHIAFLSRLHARGLPAKSSRLLHPCGSVVEDSGYRVRRHPHTSHTHLSHPLTYLPYTFCTHPHTSCTHPHPHPPTHLLSKMRLKKLYSESYTIIGHFCPKPFGLFMSDPAKNHFPISTFPYLNKIWRTKSYYILA